MKTVLITGGAGFIGSNFVYLLLKERLEYRVVCVDALTYAANIHTLDKAKDNSRFLFYKEDIRRKDGIFRIFQKEKPDIVVNFAAESHVDRSIDDPKLFLETNILGTQVMLDACCKYGVERFHQVGTDEVYGDIPYDKADMYFSEDAQLKTSSPYSASKAAADLLTLSYHRTFDLPVTISRCTNNYGPYQSPEKLIPFMVYNAINDKPLPIYGDGMNVRDWMYVRDHCNGILAILEKGRNGEIYNLGGHNEKTNNEIVDIILTELGKPRSLITYICDRKGHDRRYSIDSSKAYSELGWQPVIKFQDGMKHTIQWYKDNINWLNESATK